METAATRFAPLEDVALKQQKGSALKRLSTHFYLFAAFQLLLILAGAAGGLFIAPVSLFASQTEAQAWAWILIGIAMLVSGVLGIILLPLSIVAGIGFNRERRWGRILGIITAIIALVEFPLGTAFGIYALKVLSSKRR